MAISKYLTSFLIVLVAISLRAQETLPIYSDYLSDNVYLVHPSAAGIGNCSKLRVLLEVNGLEFKMHHHYKP